MLALVTLDLLAEHVLALLGDSSRKLGKAVVTIAAVSVLLTPSCREVSPVVVDMYTQDRQESKVVFGSGRRQVLGNQPMDVSSVVVDHVQDSCHALLDVAFALKRVRRIHGSFARGVNMAPVNIALSRIQARTGHEVTYCSLVFQVPPMPLHLNKLMGRLVHLNAIEASGVVCIMLRLTLYRGHPRYVESA